MHSEVGVWRLISGACRCEIVILMIVGCGSITYEPNDGIPRSAEIEITGQIYAGHSSESIDISIQSVEEPNNRLELSRANPTATLKRKSKPGVKKVSVASNFTRLDGKKGLATWWHGEFEMRNGKKLIVVWTADGNSVQLREAAGSPIGPQFDNSKSKLKTDKAVERLNAHAQGNSSKKQCATYVRQALEAGGIDTSGHSVDAKDYGPFFGIKGVHGDAAVGL